MIQRLVLSFLLGALTLFVFILGAEPFEKPGPTPIAAYVCGGIACFVYALLAQFWAAPRQKSGFSAQWPTLAAMLLPVLGWIPIIEEGLLTTLAAIVIPSGVGACTGAALAGRSGRNANLSEPEAIEHRQRQRRIVMVAAATAVVAGLVVLGAVIPFDQVAAANATPPRHAATIAFLVCGGLHAFVGFLLWMTARRLPGHAPSIDQLAVSTLFLFLLGMALTGATAAFWPPAGAGFTALAAALTFAVVADIAALCLVEITALAADAERPLPTKAQPAA